jgi:hypothetical protein
VPPESPWAAEAERIRAGAHELVELRLLHQVRSGRLPATDAQLAEMDRLLGGHGGGSADRLGAPAAEVVPAAHDALARWQAVAAHPFSSRELSAAARAVVRTCEGILAQNQQG